MATRKLVVPRSLPGFIEIEGGFIESTKATVAQWRAAKAFANNPYIPADRNAIRKMIRLANLAGIPDEVPLLPRLEALAATGNVTVIQRSPNHDKE